MYKDLVWRNAVGMAMYSACSHINRIVWMSNVVSMYMVREMYLCRQRARLRTPTHSHESLGTEVLIRYKLM